MLKLINVDEARAYAREHWPPPVVRRPIEELLDRCPGVEDQQDELVRGRWIDAQLGYDEWYARLYRCSLCGCLMVGCDYKFCPGCGQPMEEDDHAAD